MNGNDLQTKDEISRKKHRLQIDIVMKEADLKKILVKKEAIEMEIRGLKKDQGRLFIAIQPKEAEFKRIDFEITQLDAEVKKLKKELNIL